ncbi:AAEL000734-PA [Aedes aegypti]|uniref:AAEL000734-PA n=1 Tax=Aedes aegypti TaxID=7159 RepID=Q17ND7_AEDAE|nr:AAEL000734-PA [Aedes aegypti]
MKENLCFLAILLPTRSPKFPSKYLQQIHPAFRDVKMLTSSERKTLFSNIKANKIEFTKTLLELESDPICCGLSLSSFLMLPMQRRTDVRDGDNFAADCIPVPGIGPPGSMMRKLDKKGELVHLLWRGADAKLTYGKKFSKSSIYAFLFTGLIVLTKKKGDEIYLITDYCPRALLAVKSGDMLPIKEMQAIGKHLIIMTLLEDHEGKTIEMIISCPLTSPLQPDALDLDITEVVNVHSKMAEGWYEGERIRDRAVGWFPSKYTKGAHVRAKHIKQRHVLLSHTSK